MGASGLEGGKSMQNHLSTNIFFKAIINDVFYFSCISEQMVPCDELLSPHGRLNKVLVDLYLPLCTHRMNISVDILVFFPYSKWKSSEYGLLYLAYPSSCAKLISPSLPGVTHT